MLQHVRNHQALVHKENKEHHSSSTALTVMVALHVEDHHLKSILPLSDEQHE
jgi:hypothetical protein